MKPRRNRTPVTFEGRAFESIDEFCAAYPAYARQVHHIQAGAGTIIEVERAIAAAKASARRANVKALKSNPHRQPFVIGKGRP